MPSPIVEEVTLTLTPEEANQVRMLAAHAWAVGNYADLDTAHAEAAQDLAHRLGLPDARSLKDWGNRMIIKITQALARLPLEGT